MHIAEILQVKTVQPNPKNLFVRLARALVKAAESTSALKTAEALHAMSDADLKKRGLSRDTIADKVLVSRYVG